MIRLVNRGKGAGRALLTLLVSVQVSGVASLNGQQMIRLPDADQVLEAEVQELYRVGGSMAQDWAAFSDIRSIAFGPDGNLYLSDFFNDRIVVIDVQGNFARQIGRSGEGPGEFQGPQAVVVSAGGEIVVYDGSRRSFNLFGQDGRFVRSFTPSFEIAFPTRPMHLVSETEVLATATMAILNGEPVMRGSSGMQYNPQTRPILIYPLENDAPPQVVAEAWVPPRPEGRPGDRPMYQGFEPDMSWGPLTGGSVAFVDSVDYRIKIAEGGQISRILTRSIEPRRVTGADREAFRAAKIAELTAPGGLTGAGFGGADREANIRRSAEGMVESAVFADQVPVISKITTDWEGRIWVQRNGPSYGELGPIDIVSGDGEYIGSIPAGVVTLPDAFGPSGMAAYSLEDELDSPFVLVRKISF